MAQKTTAKKFGTAEARARAVMLRKAGATFDQIGKELKCTRQNAYKLVSTALKELQEITISETSELVALENERLDSLWLPAYKSAIGGDLYAIDRCLRISERRAKLNGLDAPKNINLGGSIGIKGYENISPDNWDAPQDETGE